MTALGSAVEIRQLTRRFGGVVALDAVDLVMGHGEFFSLLGPSGCGKTTLLRLIAGLDIPDGGSLSIGGTEVSRVPAHQRPVNTVFQSYALFPHLTVRENVAFGLHMKRVPEPEIGRKVDAMLRMVEIEPLADRKPSQLSGGQKQRVALARAIVNEPKVLLLDEPLAALDLQLRKQLQLELRALQRRLGITFIYVTHDQEEALLLSDRIAVMRAGRVEQVGDSRTLYERPRTRFVSQFLGSCSLLEVSVVEVETGCTRVRSPFGELHVAGELNGEPRRTLAIRPEKIRVLAESELQCENRVSVRVETAHYTGSATHYELSAGAQRFTLEVLNATTTRTAYNIGQTIQIQLPPHALVPLED